MKIFQFKFFLNITVFMLVLWVSQNLNGQYRYSGILTFHFQPKDNWTQFVIWIEDSSHQYIETVFITDFIGRYGGGNRSNSTDIDLPNQDGNRWSTFPIWAYKRNVIDTTYGIINYYPPDEKQMSYPQNMDAVSCATPSSSLHTATLVVDDAAGGLYHCWIEANRSYDFNRYYRYSSYRGQPSVVWTASIQISDEVDSAIIENYHGYGSPDGSDGSIHAPDSTITTASALLQDIDGYRFKIMYIPDQTNYISVSDLGTLVASDFFLMPNVPNPFNGSTKISYCLPESTFVSLKMYDILSRKVRTLVSGWQGKGIHSVYWDGKDDAEQPLPSGIYLYQFLCGHYKKTRKMVLVK